MPLTRIVNLASVCAGPILVQFPLTVFIPDNLLVIQTRNRLDIQLQVYFRLEPFIQSVVIFQHGIRNDVIVQRFVDPYVIACFAIRIVSSRSFSDSMFSLSPIKAENGFSAGLSASVPTVAIYPIVMDINTVRIIPIANITPSVEANIILKNCFISIEN